MFKKNRNVTSPSPVSPRSWLQERSVEVVSDQYIDAAAKRSWIYHLQSIWLFTRSDIKTIIGPKTVFGILSAVSAPVFGIDSAPPALCIHRKVLVTAMWTWINLLPFAIDNQRQPAAIMEDNLNKPWRPMPSRRLTPRQAKGMMLSLYPVACITSICVGGLNQCIALILLGYWYNDCGGADVSCVTRNFINACGFICYSSGAMEVALGFPLPLKPRLIQWFLIIGGAVFSTVQTQDFYDQAGDSLRGRKSVPLVLGDKRGRWITVFPMAFWSLFCPWFWNLPFEIHSAFLALGSVVIWRILTKRTVKEDKKTFRVWNLWMVFMYSLPLMKHISSA